MGQIHTLLASLAEKGIRETKIRRALLEIFLSHKELLSAPELLVELKKKKLHANKTTVYRQLELLLKEGIIHEIDLGEGKKRYELSSDDHHHHLVCIECDVIEHVTLENDLEREEKLIEKKTGFAIKTHSLEFFGLCSECQS